MKPCPYRKTHEFDDEGYCKHCYYLDAGHATKVVAPKGALKDFDPRNCRMHYVSSQEPMHFNGYSVVPLDGLPGLPAPKKFSTPPAFPGLKAWLGIK